MIAVMSIFRYIFYISTHLCYRVIKVAMSVFKCRLK